MIGPGIIAMNNSNALTRYGSIPFEVTNFHFSLYITLYTAWEIGMPIHFVRYIRSRAALEHFKEKLELWEKEMKNCL